MNKLSTEKREMILRALVEGNSIRATARMVGCSKNTVSRLLRIVGAHCKNYHDRKVRGVEAEEIQADEIWSFIGKKAANVTDEDDVEKGDAWTFTALARDSKLLIGYRVAPKRDAEEALAFMDDLAERLEGRTQLTTDGHHMYLYTVPSAFGWHQADYAQLVKIYGQGPDGQRRYSPPECIGTDKREIMGDPDPEKVCTSHVERQNLTMRMKMRRFTGLTNGFSKKLEYHLYAVALHTMNYNYCRPHGTLTKENGGVKTTPAMAAGLADRPWDAADLLDLLDPASSLQTN